ncbi:MAG: hypothetical protein AAB282_01765 [Nitrospirota bacterium]
MRICPQCRLIASDDPRCPECGWNAVAAVGGAPPPPLAARHADNLECMSIFTALMFGASLIGAFTTTRGNHFMPAVSIALLVTGLIADIFLLLLINRTASLFAEASRWTVGAALTFPFGTLIFAWLLARRVRLSGAILRGDPNGRE